MNLPEKVIKVLIDSGVKISIPYKERLGDYQQDLDIFYMSCDRTFWVVIEEEVLIETKDFSEAYLVFLKYSNNPGWYEQQVILQNPHLSVGRDNEEIRRITVENMKKVGIVSLSSDLWSS